MKRLLLLLTGILIFTAGSLMAFDSVSRSTFTATVNLTNQGFIAMSATINNLDGSPASEITWDPNEVALGQTSWLRAKQYVVLEATITASSSGIQVYTDNCAADASPQFYILNPTSANPAGLVRDDLRDRTLKLCWRLTDKPTDSLTITQGSDNCLYSNELGGEASNFRCFLWMKDHSTPDIPASNTVAFHDGEDYVTAWEENRGNQVAEGTWFHCDSPNYMYFGANFLGAASPATYKTSTMRIEAFIE